VGRAASLLSRPRAVAFVAIAAGLVAYFYSADSIPRLSLWWEVVILAAGLLPAVFLLVWLLVPLATARGLWLPALMFAVVAVLAEIGDLEVLANFAKLGAATFFAFWFLNFFEELFLIVIVAVIVPWVDAYSVFRGPTGNIVEHHSKIFTYFSFEFTLPHERDDPRLGIPDLLFFALFLAAARRFSLRTGWTWLGMVSALGATIALAAWINIRGLPALPALSLGFLLPNADLIWARLRPRPSAA
jgi:asparagine N-glycosylation enzyme membrane subunit Stt3